MNETQYWAAADQIKTQLYRTALLYLSSESQAVDAVDEAIYLGYRGYKKLREPAYFKTWMTRILINVCHKELRRHKHEWLAEDVPEGTVEEFDALPLKEAIAHLPHALRTVVILRYFNGMTLEEVARTLDLPRGTVSTRQRRALALLKLELTEEVEL